MTPKELAVQIDEIKKLTPMPGDFIVIRLRDLHDRDRAALNGIRDSLLRIFPAEQKILIIDTEMAIETHFGKCLNCGHDVNPDEH